MQLPEFSNRLRCLMSIDSLEFDRAAARCEEGASLRLPTARPAFFQNPVIFFLKADDQSQQALWRAIESRHLRAAT